MDLQVQLTEFAVTMCIGIILGAMFDFYRIMRGVCRPRQILTLLGDMLYWLVALVVTFACLLYNNWAQMRFYIFFGIILGAAGYYFFISRYVVFLLFYLVRRIAAIIKGVKRIILYIIVHPAAYCIGVCAFPFRHSYQKIQYWRNKSKKTAKIRNCLIEIAKKKHQ